MNKKKRPMRRTRRTIIFIAFLLFPLLFKYLSPYTIVVGALEGVLAVSAATFAVLFTLSLFFGRFWCGWICPGGGVAEACDTANPNPSPNGKLLYIKWAIWVVWLAAIILFLVKSGQVLFDPLFHMETGISLADSDDIWIYYTVIIILVILPLFFGRRAMCKYICWMAPFQIIGRKIANLLRLPALRLKSNKAVCISCKICDKECPMSLEVLSMVEKGNMEHAECILCGNCVESCPKKAINFKVGTGSRL